VDEGRLMSAWKPVLGRGRHGVDGDSTRPRRGLFTAILCVALTVALLGVVCAAPSGTPFLVWLSSAARAATQALRAPSASSTTAQPPPPPSASAQPRLTWPTYMGENARSGEAASATTLTAAMVGHLSMQWTRHAAGPIFAQPVVASGLIYWGSWDGVEHATSAATGQDIWERYLGQSAVLACGSDFGVSSTATVAFAPVQGRRTLLVFVGGGNGVFYALNAQTGAVVWKTLLGHLPAAYLWSSPAADDGAVYMGVSSLADCPLVQGQVVKLSAGTGKIEAVFNTVPNGCLGGSVWGSVTIDQNTGTLYFGTGNPGDCPVNEPYAEAVVALRTSDLSLVGAWQDQRALQQVSDSDFGSTPNLFSVQSTGSTHQMVGIVNKDGNFYAFDAAHVSRGPVWTTRVADVAGCTSCSSGGFVPGAWDGTLLYESDGKTTINRTFCAGGLRALNPANGSLVWSGCFDGPTFAALTLGPDFLVLGAGPRLLIVGTAGAAKGHILYTLQDPQAPTTHFFGAPCLADGRLIVGDADGNLLALGV
jgi:polyvinyl alcohol dehydrogenase (cytochrome)